MEFLRLKNTLVWGVPIVIVLCAALALFLCVDSDRGTDEKAGGVCYQQRTTEALVYEPSSELPSELQAVLDQFPGYDGRYRSARFFAGVFKLIDVWRLDDASKEMFQFALLDNGLVGSVLVEVDDIFWSIPLSWWTPCPSTSSLCAVSPDGHDVTMEGEYAVLLFKEE